MQTLTKDELNAVIGGGGLDFLNDAARELGGAVAGAVDSVQTKLNEVGAYVKATVIQSNFQ